MGIGPGEPLLERSDEGDIKALKTNHHFTLPYCPWSNGTVEVVCRELKKVMKSITNEFRLPTKAWKFTLPIVQLALNNSPLRRLNGKFPLTLFTGHPQESPVAAIVDNSEETARVHNIDIARMNSFLKLED